MSYTSALAGTVANSAPYQFFVDSNLTLFQDIRAYMDTQNTLVADSTEGLTKVMQMPSFISFVVWLSVSISIDLA